MIKLLIEELEELIAIAYKGMCDNANIKEWAQALYFEIRGDAIIDIKNKVTRLESRAKCKNCKAMHKENELMFCYNKEFISSVNPYISAPYLPIYNEEFNCCYWEDGNRDD